MLFFWVLYLKATSYGPNYSWEIPEFGDVCEFSIDPNFDLYLLSIPY